MRKKKTPPAQPDNSLTASSTAPPSGAQLASTPVHTADEALFSGRIKGLISLCYENERPLGGLAGLMDWRFRGAISRCVRSGNVSGKVGECVYFPMTRNGVTYHLILAGAGYSASNGERAPAAPGTLEALRRNLGSLKLSPLGVSRQDFGNVPSEYFAEHFKGVELCVCP